MTAKKRKLLFMLHVTLSPTKTSARKYYFHKMLTPEQYRGVVLEVCVAMDVDRRTGIRVDSTCAAATDAQVSVLICSLR